MAASGCGAGGAGGRPTAGGCGAAGQAAPIQVHAYCRSMQYLKICRAAREKCPKSVGLMKKMPRSVALLLGCAIRIRGHSASGTNTNTNAMSKDECANGEVAVTLCVFLNMPTLF